MARSALKILQVDVAAELRRAPAESGGRILATAARALESAQPAMGAFRQWSLELRELSSRTPTGTASTSFVRWCRWWDRHLNRESRGVHPTVARRLPPRARLVTISRSEFVLSALRSAPKATRPSLVTVLRSEPGGEGVETAASLRALGLSVHLAEDREGPNAVRESDLVIIGADAVLRDGSIVHKVGTRTLADAALDSGAEAWAVTGTSKFVDLTGPEFGRLPSLFDHTPASEVTWIGTEAGVLRPDQLSVFDFERAIRYAASRSRGSARGGRSARRPP